MGGLVKNYYEQLNRASSVKEKCFALQRFVADTTGKSINFKIIAKMAKLYGFAAVFNAIVAVNNKDFETEQDLINYLFGIYRRNFAEEEINKVARVRPERRPVEEVIKEIINIDKEIHGRNNNSRK